MYGRKKEDAARLFVRGARRRVLGASGTVGQYLFTCQGVDSGWLTVVRMFLAGVVLLGGALVRHRPQLQAIWSDRRDALRLVLFSVGGLMTCQYTYLAAIRYSNSATATVLQYMGQALILLWVCLRARKPARLHQSRSARRCARRSGCTRASRGRIFSALLPFW